MTALRGSFLVAWLALVALSAGLAVAAVHRHIGAGAPHASTNLALNGAGSGTPDGIPALPGDDDGQHHDCALCSAAATIAGAALAIGAEIVVSLAESPVAHRAATVINRRVTTVGAFEARAPPVYLI